MSAPDLAQAASLGAKAFHDGRLCVPALDPDFVLLLKGKGSSILALLDAWLGAWHAANLKPSPTAG